MKLYEITSDLAQIEGKMEEFASEHEGDITEFPLNDELEALEGERDSKVLSIGCWFKNLTSNAEALKREKAVLAKRQQVLENKAESLKAYMESCLPKGYKLEDSKVKIGWRKSHPVTVNCEPEDLPEEYQSTSVSANKTALKDAIAEGKEIKDVEINTKQNIQIK